MWGSHVANMPSIGSYEQAKTYYFGVKPVRGRKDTNRRPIARRSDNARQMRQLDDGSIAFRLFSTDVVTWHPDNSVTLEGWLSQMTSVFANALLPEGITLEGARGIALFGGMRSRWDVYTGREGRRWRDDIHVVACGHGDRVRFVQQDGLWAPAPDQKLSPIHWIELDRVKARALSKEYRMDELRLWVRTVQKLGGELPDKERPSAAKAYHAARRGDFAAACAQISRSASWVNTAGVWDRGYKITDSSFRLAREELYRDQGAYLQFEATTMSYADWVRHVYNNRRTDK